LDESDSLTAQRNRRTEAARLKGEERAQLLATVNGVNAERERLQREADTLLEKQKQMVIREAEALDALDNIDSPEQASPSVFVRLDDRQWEEIWGSLRFLGAHDD
jgi:regulator of protease activity HflC (stomatin/prohibitin superfamily)